MSEGKLTKKESVLMDRKKKRKHLLKKSAVFGFKRPEGWGAEAQATEGQTEVTNEVNEVIVPVDEVEIAPEEKSDDSTTEFKVE